MGFSNLLSSALTAVATLSGNPDLQRAADSANELVISYQTQQQQEMAKRILSSPDGIAPFTEKGQTVWRALQYNENGEIVGFADFSTKEEYLLLKQQELYAQQVKQQQMKVEQQEAERRYAAEKKQKASSASSQINAYGNMVITLEQAAWSCTNYPDYTPSWDACIKREINKADQRR